MVDDVSYRKRLALLAEAVVITLQGFPCGTVAICHALELYE